MSKKEAQPTVHVPIEPAGINSTGTMHFSQGLLPTSCWLVVPANAIAHPQVPVPQIQVMNTVDYMKVIEIACADLAITTKMKMMKTNSKPYETTNQKDYMTLIKDQIDRTTPYNRALAMLNASGAPSPNQSISPVSMSPRASNDR